jgi:protocatechuate 3,4-dioxygenase beta subunit
MESQKTGKNKDMSRKEALGVLGLTGVSILVGCGGGGGDTITTPTPTPDPSATPAPGSCVLIPSETEGPYPLYSVLSNSAMNRANITEGKAGVPLMVTFKLVNVGSSCGPVTNGFVYIWHTDKEGNYSGYGNSVGQTFMRGYQAVNSNGEVTFTTVYPGWYQGRITHIHFQVYLNGVNGAVTATSQIAMPIATNQTVYASTLYSAKGQNTSVADFSSDGIFRDNVTRGDIQYEIPTITGSVSTGYAATLVVGVRAS